MQPSPLTKPSAVDPHSPPPSEAILLVGIDWAQQSHAVCLIEPHGDSTPRHSQLPHQPDAIAAWAAQLRQAYPRHQLCVVLEQSRGALMHALLATGEFLLFPINPRQLARYREAVHPSGGKNDPTDAELLARFLQHHRQQLRPWQPDTPQTRRIAHLVEFRRKLVEERKRLTQKLAGTLRMYFPFLLEHFCEKLASPLVTMLLKKWPSLAALKRPHPQTLRTFFKEHGVKGEQRREALVQAIRSARPLTRDAALIDTHATYAQSLARQLQELAESIAQFDGQLQQAVAQHEDAPLFRSLPGAGDVLVPRLIAAFGSDRDRYESAEQVQSYSGIAPVTQQSGKSRCVKRRYACPKFLRQTFHEFADHSRKWSPWAKAWYRHKREGGMKHNAALRALAFKWIRIIFRLWKNRESYSEQRYLDALRKAGSPIVPLLQNN
jgi:transposase